MVLITALSSSDDKVQALDLAKRRLQLFAVGSVINSAKENEWSFKEYWF